ncbi:MAG: YHS domain-containing (seleno)protein [Natronomonas sp.]
MNRRRFLLATGAAVVPVAGCLEAGSNGGDTDGSTNTPTAEADRSGGDGFEIDPDAPHVVEGPEGLFSARGRWNTDLDGVVIHGYDLVAYFEAERPVEGSPAHEQEYDGVTFRFASERNRDVFAADPESYLPEFGGYCSLGVGNGYKDGMHPEAFDIFDGDLYFNLTPSIHQGWLRNHEERIETAEKNWAEIKESTDPLHIGPGIS